MRIALTVGRTAPTGESSDYVRSLVGAGFAPAEIVVLQPGAVVGGPFDGVVLGGGCDVDPARYGESARPDAEVEIDLERDALDFELFGRALEGGVPVLAICRGLQVVNVALGGTLIQDIPTQNPTEVPHDVSGGDKSRREHEVAIFEGSRLAAVAGAASVEVNSRHHQAIARPAVALVITGRSSDGLIEAAEGAVQEPWLIGVQWHPENLAPTGDAASRSLFSEFARQVRARAEALEAGAAATVV